MFLSYFSCVSTAEILDVFQKLQECNFLFSSLIRVELSFLLLKLLLQKAILFTFDATLNVQRAFRSDSDRQIHNYGSRIVNWEKIK